MDKEEILSLAQPILQHLKICVYALIKENEIVYVGQTVTGLPRILNHIYTKDFDSYSLLTHEFFGVTHDVFAKYLDYYEEIAIIELNPKYNISTTQLLFCNFDKIKKTYKIGLREVKKLIRMAGIEHETFNGKQYYKWEDIINIFGEIKKDE